MSTFFCQPGGAAVGGDVRVPGDKSISHRVLLLASIAEGPTLVRGFLESADCLVLQTALRDLGVNFTRQAGKLVIHGVGAEGLRPSSRPLNLGNSAGAIRLLTALLAGQSFDATLTGDAGLMRRSMDRIAVPLRLMNADVETSNGFPPVHVRGGRSLRAIEYEMPMPSPQLKAALLIAGLLANGRTFVIDPLHTRDHTERLLRAFGAEVLRDGAAVAIEGGQALTGTTVDIPGDFSSAAFLITLGVLSAEKGLIIRGVGVNPTRTAFLELLHEMGAYVRLHPGTPPDNTASASTEPVADIEVRASRLRGITVPESLVSLALDELPAFFIAAACAEGESLVRGAHELRVKKSDRLNAMAQGLGRLGVEHELLPDGLWIRGGQGFSGGVVDSFGDHRIAMAFAVAAARAAGPLEIRDVANVATSFPGFVQTARSVGLQIEAL
jgi:3-phosphoshikimate 1-carboxyvinyltransferase